MVSPPSDKMPNLICTFAESDETEIEKSSQVDQGKKIDFGYLLNKTFFTLIKVLSSKSACASSPF